MGTRHKVAAKNRLGKTPEERSFEMSRRAKIGWKKMDQKKKMKLMKNMNKARWQK